MADDKLAETEVAQAAEEEHKQQEEKGTPTRKKSLGGIDSASVLTGPRQRKKAEHFQVEVKEKAEFVIKAGKGTKLGDIPNVHYLLSKLKTDDELMTSLHNLVFKRPGTAHRRKRNLYEFSGLAFEHGDKEKELEKVQERLGKWTISLLNGALDAFELPRGNGDEGKKEAKVERLLRFLEEPKKLSEKDLAAQAAKKKDAAKVKKEKEQKGKTPKSGRRSEGGQESAKKKRSRKADSEEGAEEPSSEAEEEPPEPDEQPKKRAKKEGVAAPKKEAEKKSPPSRKSTGKKRKADEEEAEGVGEVHSGAELPTNEEIHEATLELLKVSDVNTTTVKDLLNLLKKKFGVDLTKKKKLIKTIAVDYAKTKAAVSEDAADAVEDAVVEDDAPATKKQKKKEPEAAEDAIDEDTVAGSTEEGDGEAAEMKVEDAEPEATEADAEPEVEETAVEETVTDDSTKPKVEVEGAQEPIAKPKEESAAEETVAEDGKAIEAEESKD